MEDLDPKVYVDQVAKVLQLPLQPDHRPGVVENFARILPIAKLVLEFPLPQTVEAAPTFDPAPGSGTESLL
ncbi:MAG: DUF4089 domain-containing protein [Cyanobacteriota bacterium]